MRTLASAVIAGIITAVTGGDMAKFDTLFIISLIAWVMMDTEELKKKTK